jgi:hypothetical protein
LNIKGATMSLIHNATTAALPTYKPVLAAPERLRAAAAALALTSCLMVSACANAAQPFKSCGAETLFRGASVPPPSAQSYVVFGGSKRIGRASLQWLHCAGSKARSGVARVFEMHLESPNAPIVYRTRTLWEPRGSGKLLAISAELTAGGKQAAAVRTELLGPGRLKVFDEVNDKDLGSGDYGVTLKDVQAWRRALASGAVEAGWHLPSQSLAWMFTGTNEQKVSMTPQSFATADGRGSLTVIQVKDEEGGPVEDIVTTAQGVVVVALTHQRLGAVLGHSQDQVQTFALVHEAVVPQLEAALRATAEQAAAPQPTPNISWRALQQLRDAEAFHRQLDRENDAAREFIRSGW